MERTTLKRIGIGTVLTGLSYMALDKAVDYDNDVSPSVGIVTKRAEPEYDCYWNGKFNSCGWEYWLYVDGCGVLPPEAIEIARDREDNWEPARGWVSVTSDTWENNQQGELIQFSERSFLNSVEILGIGSDDTEPCE